MSDDPSSIALTAVINEVLQLAALVRDLKERIEVLEKHTHIVYLAKNNEYHPHLTTAPNNPQ
jgi:hypothetical protein